ncbi:formate dehydrogenase accessory sulfurtransferase FdhD [Bradyrhizobium rifense]|nr:formate dehydrogenase accessory sulfurtransferase FdhD [Bradyrhizobium rifense]
MHLASLDQDRAALLPAMVNAGRLNHRREASSRLLAEEAPVALIYNGISLAVLMATPADLTDLAVGFSLTEGIISNPAEIRDMEIICHPEGTELRAWLTTARGRELMERRRQLVGPTGCGLCGLESLQSATRVLPSVPRGISLRPPQIAAAVQAMVDAQELNRRTRATHAAGLYLPQERTILVREDVGRHNALDKLAGALAARGISGCDGALVLSSRVSVELVQKAAMMGAGLLIAVSAPTALAVRTAEACGMTVIGIARGQEYDVFSHSGRILPG